MKLSDLYEMPLRAGNLEKSAQDFADKNREQWLKAEHVGDIGQLIVRKDKLVYSVWDGDKLVACASLEDGKYGSIVDNVWVNKDYRRQKIFSKLLWFFKSREGRDKLLLGKVHSDDTYQLINGVGLSRFQKYWIKDGKTEPFSPATVDKFYGSEYGWQLVLENGDDFFNDFPRFSGCHNWIQEDYEWQIA